MNRETEDESNSDDEIQQTQAFFEDSPKQKEKSAKKNLTKKKKEIEEPIFVGWEKQNQIETKNIDFGQWQAAHPCREAFFIGPDHYIYQNASSMKKFVEVLKKGEVDEKSVSIPISPMTKVVATNPRMTLSVTGSRYIQQNGGGYRVLPIYYLAKEYVSYVIF